MKAMFASLTYKSSLYQFFYPLIVADVHPTSLPADYGMISHVKATWQAFPLMGIFVRKPGRIKMARWFQWFDIVSPFLDAWHALLMVLAWKLMQDGTISKLEDLQRNQAAIDANIAEAKAEEAARKAAGLQKKATVRHSNSEVDALRKVTKNTPHLSAMLLYNRRLYIIILIIKAVLQPIRDRHAEEVVMLRTAKGTLHFYTSMHGGVYDQVLASVVNTMQDADFVVSLGLSEIPRPYDLKNPKISWEAFPYAEDDEIANIHGEIVLQILRHRGCAILMYSKSFAFHVCRARRQQPCASHATTAFTGVGRFCMGGRTRQKGSIGQTVFAAVVLDAIDLDSICHN